MNHPWQIDNGYAPVLDCHTFHIDVKFAKTLTKIDRCFGKELEKEPKFVKMILTKPMIMEIFFDCPPLEQLDVCDIRQTAAMGVVKVVEKKEANCASLARCSRSTKAKGFCPSKEHGHACHDSRLRWGDDSTEVKEYELIRRNFSYTGCFGFAIHIDLGIKYDPSIGIYGMDFYVVLERASYRVGKRKRGKARVGIQHKVTKENARKCFQVKYEGVILNKSQAITN
ncbi:hypothetical protein L7F22_034010 [Adiantum nelumboides]|nr:hypothetical protein [Adiantum nelumboides]